MSSKKTIQINPELFKMTGNKTKKTKGKKELTINPVINPNSLKNKLLKRIKEHKTNELKPNKTTQINVPEKTYTDEFYGALDYLSEVSKNKRKIKALQNKTLKQPITTQLPTQLNINLNEPTIIPNTPDVFNVNYKQIPDDVPYGCLKNGKKKTYREWKEMNTPGFNELIRPPTPPKQTGNNSNTFNSKTNAFLHGAIPENKTPPIKTSRELKLEEIKNKLRKAQDEETREKQKILDEFDTLKKQHLEENSIVIPTIEAITEDNVFNQELEELKGGSTELQEILSEMEEKELNELNENKKYIKKTVKRKFTLGKSDKLRQVSILVKDRQTRKKLVETHKQLKQTNINDIKKFLRQRGMIKVGSTCPADVLRKTFECAMMAGEVTNTNKETLLHNFMSNVS